MIKQFLKKRVKICKGVFNTYIRKRGQNYRDTEWYDNYFYIKGISDRQTISPKKSLLSAKYHYNSVEMQILKYLYNNKIQLEDMNVLDIGSGSGHWIDFYKTIGVYKIVGIDVSISSVNYLKEKYSENVNVDIHHGKAYEILNELDEKYNLINAIGVMFHIVDDSEWINTINAIAKVLRKNGLFIVGGHFGLLNGLNVQIFDDQINKRLRSKKNWINILKKAGFRHIYFYKNYAYLYINDTLPENNILIATK